MGLDIAGDGTPRSVIARLSPRFGWDQSDDPEKDAWRFADGILDALDAEGWVLGRVLRSGFVDLQPVRHRVRKP